MFGKIIVALVVLGALGAVFGEEEAAPPAGESDSYVADDFGSDSGDDSDYEPEADFEITAEMVVDVTPGMATRKWCNSVYMLGYEAALEGFSSGYGKGQPTAREVFDEALSRC